MDSYARRMLQMQKNQAVLIRNHIAEMLGGKSEGNEARTTNTRPAKPAGSATKISADQMLANLGAVTLDA